MTSSNSEAALTPPLSKKPRTIKVKQMQIKEKTGSLEKKNESEVSTPKVKAAESKSAETKGKANKSVEPKPNTKSTVPPRVITLPTPLPPPRPI